MTNAYTPASVVSGSFIIDNYVLIAGSDGFFVNGYNGTDSIGSLTPNTFSGVTINALFASDDGVANFYTYMSLGSNVAQSFITSITFNGMTLLTADADSFSTGGGSSDWQWDNQLMFTTTGTYIGNIT